MSKKISPKRYVYDNGILILKKNENESTQVNINLEQISKNKKKINIEFPVLSLKNNIYSNSNKIFSTELDEEAPKESKKEESEKNLSFSDDKKETKDYNNNLKSIEVNHSFRKSNPKFIRKLNRTKLSSEIKKMCKYLYTSPRKSSKENIKFKIIEKENDYIKNIKKNYLVDQDLINKQTYRNRIKKRKNNSSNQSIFLNKQIYRNINNNILDDNEIIKKYYNENNRNTINTINIDKFDKLSSYKFENYKRYIPKYKHPQIYRLKNLNKFENILPPIKTGNQTPIDLTEVIPIKKGITKEEQRKEYLHYKIMRCNRFEVFHL